MGKSVVTNQAVSVIRVDLGIIDGLQTWQVLNADTNEVIGLEQLNTPSDGEI